MLSCLLLTGGMLRGHFLYDTSKGILLMDGWQNIQYQCLLVQGYSSQEALDSIAQRYQLKYVYVQAP